MRIRPLLFTAIFVAAAVSDFAADDTAIVDLRPKFATWGIGNRKQGARNTCSVCVTTAAFEFALARANNQGTTLSVEYLNWACNQVIGNTSDDRGQFFHDLLRAQEKFGICKEILMPYKPRFDPAYTPSEKARLNGEAIKTNAFQVKWIRKWDGTFGLTDTQISEIQSTLRRGWPVALGSSHSVLLAGFRETENEPGGGVFIALDSGSGAFKAMSFEVVRTNSADAFFVELPLKKPASQTPSDLTIRSLQPNSPRRQRNKKPRLFRGAAVLG